MSGPGASRAGLMRRFCRPWIAVSSYLVPRSARDGWIREWYAEIDVLLHEAEASHVRRVVAYVSVALPDALTLRAFAIADVAHALGDGSLAMLRHPVRAGLGVAVLCIPMAITVVVFQCARATLASRPASWDVVLLALVAAAALAGLTWSATRTVAHATAPITAAAEWTPATVALVAALLSIPLVKVGLVRIGATVLRSPAVEPAMFYGDFWTVAIWIVVTFTTWRLAVRAIAPAPLPASRERACANGF